MGRALDDCAGSRWVRFFEWGRDAVGGAGYPGVKL